MAGMRMAVVNADIRELAKVGAQLRIKELDQQELLIRTERKRMQAIVNAKSATDGTDDAPVRRRRHMSRDARKRISEAQKKRWAKVHATNGKK
jgi:hypothetical protein